MPTEIDLGNVIGPTGPKGDTGDVGPRGDTGPKGDPGQDAQLPSSGTPGQVLTKTASGEEWRSYLRVEDLDSGEYALRSVFVGADRNVPHIKIVSNGGSGVIDLDTNGASPNIKLTGSSKPQINIESNFGEYVRLSAQSDGYAEISTNGRLTIGSKYVSSITDTISASPKGNALVTDKAVADYVKSLVATDEEFDTFMGLS